MNRLLSTLFLFGLSLTAAAQVTLRPQVERRSSGDVTVLKVEHTAAHTILTLRFAQPALSPVEQQLYERYPERFTHISTISIDPDSYLSGTLDGVQQQAKFVKANGIPVQPDRQRVGPGDVVSFQVYYERLKPGIASFSLFECQSSNDFQCWNFYGIRATNPRQRTATPPKPATAPPPVARKPAPAPAAPKTIRLTGQVRDARTKEPLAASLAYRKARVRVDSVQTVPSLGVYRTALAAGTYTVTIRARGVPAAARYACGTGHGHRPRKRLPAPAP
jgi:OOP family OmpA-OmpF porin